MTSELQRGNGTELASVGGEGAAVQIAQTRAAQEVQAQIVSAKRFPRDVIQAQGRILRECQRMGLAKDAMYAYPKGGQRIEGPSVHLARAMARNWGNVDVGWSVLEQHETHSLIRAYCYDLETNVRQAIDFTVKHAIGTRSGPKVLTDPRDIYEHCANMAARRVRACVLAIIPIDIQEAAVEQCRKTLLGDSDVPLADRAVQMLRAFEAFGVTQELMETRLGHKLEAISPAEFVTLRSIYQSMKDEASSREQWFDVEAEEPAAADLTPGRKQTAAQQTRAKPESKAPEPEPESRPEHEDTAEAMKTVAFMANAKLRAAELAECEDNVRKLLDFVMLGEPGWNLDVVTRDQCDELMRRLSTLDPAEIATVFAE